MKTKSKKREDSAKKIKSLTHEIATGEPNAESFRNMLLAQIGYINALMSEITDTVGPVSSFEIPLIVSALQECVKGYGAEMSENDKDLVQLLGEMPSTAIRLAVPVAKKDEE